MSVVIDGTNGITTPAEYSPIIGAGTGSSLSLQSNGVTNATLDTNGNLGLGVTPSAWSSGRPALEFGGSIQSNIAFNGNVTNGGLILANTYYNGSSFVYKNNGPVAVFEIANGFHAWYNAPSGTAGTAATLTQAMTLDNSGNLLVGATSASSNGGPLFQYGGNENLIFYNNNTANNGNGIQSTSASSTSGGNWLFTGMSAATGASTGTTVFYVKASGAIFSTSTSITAISDVTLKTNIKPLETGLSEVLKLQPRRFDWINGDGQNVAGFIAQEVEEVLPDLVSNYELNENETKKAIKMGDMIPTLVKAIQEQQEMINQLKAEIAELKGVK